jgi:hypothetical protein
MRKRTPQSDFRSIGNCTIFGRGGVGDENEAGGAAVAAAVSASNIEAQDKVCVTGSKQAYAQAATSVYAFDSDANKAGIM